MSEPSEPLTPPSPPPAADHVAAIYAALGGQPVLLCIPRGRKGPMDKGWDRITWSDTKEADYQARLREGCNLGVRLGCASSLRAGAVDYHLCSIDVDETPALEPFLELNPKLRQSLTTSGRRGANIWLWVRAGTAPLFSKLCHALPDGVTPDRDRAWGEWRADGLDADKQPRAFQTVIWGTHPEKTDTGEPIKYRRVSAATSPLLIDFAEIVWPESLAVPWRKTAWDELVEANGQPWIKNKNGGLSLNPPFFVAKYALERRVLFEPEEGRFYDYDAKRGLWVVESEDAVQWKFATDFKKVADDAAKAPEPHRIGSPEALHVKRTPAFLRGLVQSLQGCVERREAFRREPGVIHLQNGMLDLRATPPGMDDFGPDYYSRNQIPVMFAPEARCPVFLDKLIGAGVGNAEDISLLKRWAGQLLLGHNLTQKILVLTGTAGGGKTTLLNVFAEVIGRANVAGLRTEHLHQRFELWNYVGKTFLVGADVPGNFLMTEGAHVLKALVGKDVLTAEKKNGDSVTIVGDFNVGLTSNSRLKVKLDGDTAAWRRRMLIVNYEMPAPERPNPRFLEELLASEASGILNWMIAGAMELLAEIKEWGAMRLTDRQKDRVDSLLAESDSVREFVRKGVAPAAGGDVTSHELVTAYVRFCEARGWNPVPTKKVENALPDAILEILRVSKRNDVLRTDHFGAQKQQRGYHGLRILPIDARSEDAPEPAARAAAADDQGEERGIFDP